MTANHDFSVGSIRCIALSDGSFSYTSKMLFANAPVEAAEQEVRNRGLAPGAIPMPYVALFLNSGGHRILIDTGMGAGVAPGCGLLHDNLRSAGIAPESVDTVILTHAHPDHIGGNLTGDGKRAFPNARYIVAKAEWDFWTAESTLERFAAGTELDQFIAAWARRNLPPVQAGVELVERETEAAPGITVIPAAGHTPGHMAVQISSGHSQLLYIADAVLHPIHLEHPEWRPVFDIDPDQAAATRRQLLDRAASDKIPVMAYHFPFPGLGRVVRRGVGWTWEAATARGV